jgi:hypothetical protein
MSEPRMKTLRVFELRNRGCDQAACRGPLGMARVSRVLALALLLVVPTAAHAQRCKKGIPCGRSCIAANKTCRIGSPDPSPPPVRMPASAPARYEPPTTSPAPTARQPTAIPSPLMSPASPVPPDISHVQRLTTLSAQDSGLLRLAGYIGSKADSVYFGKWCTAANDLGASNRRYFRNEAEALAAGFRRSRAPGC